MEDIYTEGVVIGVRSQCVGCTNNLSGEQCEYFTIKPRKYLFCRDFCPQRVDETTIE